ncbi:glycerophosphodiester phosphodiesterase [Pseudonocardia sp.]|uniref:glycerophosphodiester phosphodiesterase n=1 Tax=Pseudonocardia sp. TaxID=60912 RepID=UPI00260F43D3|nr:glycerophosphodiester phosphodiesterase [Pseudonocardia sp.]
MAVLSAVTVAGAPSAVAPAAQHRDGETASVVVIGHRGAAGYRPEHTLASYELAARLGADFIEPDLVTTADGVLVARHEPEIGATTDVAEHPEFADRVTTKTVDGAEVTGWFTEDFTLAELRTLRATERIPDVRQENTIYDRRYLVPTFDEVLALRERLSAELGREIGVYPETKHPTYFAALGLPLEPALVKALDEAGLNRADAPVIVQSFETTNLRALDTELEVPLVALLEADGAPADLVAAGDPRTYLDLITPQGLADLAAFADGIGPDKNLVVSRNADGTLGTPTTLVADAHAAGLLVHPYTFRNENQFLPADLRAGTSDTDYGDAFAEYTAFFEAGVDGVFSDNPDTAVAARAAHTK